MKTKLTRAGRRSLSIVLAVMMIISTMLIGTFTATAATVDTDPVGADTYYLWYSEENSTTWANSTIVPLNADKSVTVSLGNLTGYPNYMFIISTSNTIQQNPTAVWSTNSPTVTISSECTYAQYGGNGYWAGCNAGKFQGKPGSPAIVKFTFDGDKTVTLSNGSSSEVVDPTTPPETEPTTPPSGEHSLYLYGDYKAESTNTWGKEGEYKDDPFIYNEETGWYVTGDIAIKGSQNGASTNAFFRFYDANNNNQAYGPSVSEDVPLSNGTETSYTANNKKAFYYDAGSTGKTIQVYVNLETSKIKVVEVVEEPTEPTPSGAYKIGTSFTGNGTANITNKTTPGLASGTANADDSISFTLTPDSNYTLDAKSVIVSYTEVVENGDGTTTKTAKTADVTETGGTYTFTMPAYDVTISATFNITKSQAYSSGLWVDVQPSVKTSSIALIKWTNKTGSSGGTLSNNNYILYIPGGVSLTLPVYSKFSTLTIDGKTVDNGKTFTFEDKKSYTVNGGGTTYNLTVYQSTSNAIYTTTTTTDAKAKDGNNLPTQAYGAEIDKTIYTGQFMTSTGKDGAICNPLMDIVQIKGRGNSSWEASGKFYGKYAYNIKLADKILPLNMDKNYATKAKSWCLLANNMDETGLRNVTVFEAAKRAGLSNVPEYKVADLYNNGEYLGSYLITEKVGVGKSKLVNGDTVDEHYDNTGSGNKVKAKYEYNSAQYDFQYVDAGNLKEGFSNDKLSYLLEFDLESRAKEENCWFKTPKGQYVVVKAPEDVNREDMLFIINKWVEVENTVYNGTYEDIAGVLDLDSFADVYLIQEFTKNLDAGATSYYVYWNGNGAADPNTVKWEATPIWDYDWALGGHGGTKDIDTSGTDANNEPATKNGWLAKYKYILQDDNKTEEGVKTTLNFQAKLANNSDFWNTNVVNAWNSDIYDSIKAVFGTSTTNVSESCYLYDAYQANLPSYTMNETRYSFIAKDPLDTLWGGIDTGDNLADCYKYLKDWAVTRANWMSEKLTETVSVSLDASVDTNTNTITLTPSVTRSKSSTYPLTYKYYQSKDNGAYELIYETTDATYTTAELSTGSYTYKVEATYSTYTKATSTPTSAISIQGNEPVLGSVTVEAPSTAITGETFTVTVTPTITSGDASTSQITYKLYTSDGTQVATKTVTGTSAAALTATAPTVETATDYTYYVTATLGETTVHSANFTISVDVQQGSHPVTIYFKAPSTSVYTPYVSLNGDPAVALTKDTTKNLGTIYSGALSIYWWKTTLTIDSTNTNTLKFTTKGTQANGSISDKFNGSEYYFAIDNLVSGTELVNLTGKDEYIQNFYLTPLHMASPDINNATDTNLGFTNVGGVRYRMGAKVDKNGGQSVSIDSATSAQRYIASLTPLSQLQSQLYDVNLDGEVNIDDATLIQKSLVG